ncbi:lysis system o-spanin lipoprotein Rz1, partial [Yersinia ruckeri]
MALSGCSSTPVVSDCPKPQSPPAALMMPAPDMMQNLNAII